MGLAQGKSAKEISKLYKERGERIFPGNRLTRRLRNLRRWSVNPYDRHRLENELRREFGDALLGSVEVPTCIPSFEGRYGEPYIFNTPYHPDYKKDQFEELINVGLSTAAAPTYFSAIERDGYFLALQRCRRWTALRKWIMSRWSEGVRAAVTKPVSRIRRECYPLVSFEAGGIHRRDTAGGRRSLDAPKLLTTGS